MSLSDFFLRNKVSLVFGCLSMVSFLALTFFVAFSDWFFGFGNILFLFNLLFGVLLFFGYGWSLGDLIVSRGRAEYAWLILGVVVIQFVVLGYEAIALYSAFSMLFILTIPAQLFQVEYALQALFGWTQSFSMYAGFALSLGGIMSLAAWLYLYVTNQENGFSWIVILRRALLLVFLLVFFLGLYGCSVSPFWAGSSSPLT